MYWFTLQVCMVARAEEVPKEELGSRVVAETQAFELLSVAFQNAS